MTGDLAALATLYAWLLAEIQRLVKEGHQRLRLLAAAASDFATRAELGRVAVHVLGMRSGERA
jgi:hypothetical protein